MRSISLSPGRRLLVKSLAAAAALFVASPASAAGDDGPALSAGVLGGYGFGIGDFTSNPYGVGVGMWAGMTLFVPYVGARFVYHVGTSNSQEAVSSSGTPQGMSLTQRSWLAGIDLGADVWRDVVIVRPLVGIGVLHGESVLTTTGAGDLSTNGKSVGYLAPGAMFLFGTKGPIGGVDARYVARLGGSGSPALSGVEILGTIGIGL